MVRSCLMYVIIDFYKAENYRDVVGVPYEYQGFDV